MQISEHFTLDELTHSDFAVRKGIDNQPASIILPNLHLLAAGLEEVRRMLGAPIRITSGYRCPLLNHHIGGSVKSAHMDGFAADFTAPNAGTPQHIVTFLAAQQDLRFDQLIQEGTWVHVSFAPAMRREVLTAHFEAGHPVRYTAGV